MENFDLIRELINTMGFPIVMVGYFIWDKTKNTKHLADVIENNNMILQKLLTKLDKEDLAHE